MGGERFSFLTTGSLTGVTRRTSPSGKNYQGKARVVFGSRKHGVHLRNTWKPPWKYGLCDTQMKRRRGLWLFHSLSKYFEVMETTFLSLCWSMRSSLSDAKELREAGLSASPISKVSYHVTSLGEVEFYLFLSVLCDLKASWIIKPAIFQAWKCVQCVAPHFLSQHMDWSEKTPGRPPPHTGMRLLDWYLGCSHKLERTCVSPRPPRGFCSGQKVLPHYFSLMKRRKREGSRQSFNIFPDALDFF